MSSPTSRPRSSARPLPPEPELAALVARCHRDGVATARGGGWELEEVARGSNGIVFHARSASQLLAAKVSQVDERGRASRELAALRALSEAGLDCAPAPHGVVRIGDLDILFSEWREGEPLDEAPPRESPSWPAVVDAYAEVHGRCDPASLAPTVLGVDLPQVVEDMRARLQLFDGEEGERVVEAAARRIPDRLPPPRRALVHCEASLANFLGRGNGSLTIVDWENSGLGDACFDPANIVTAPQHARYEPEAWDDVFVRHARLLGDESLARRTRVHAVVMVAWWVVRLRQESAAPTPRLEGVAAAARDLLEQRLAASEERAAAVLGI